MELDAQRYPALAAARARSRGVLAALRAVLAAAPRACAPFLAIAASGSLGRGEAGAAPDLDAVFVTAAGADEDAVRDGMQFVFAEARRLGLRAPKGDGIYVTPVTREALLDQAARGALEESPSVFGKRFALLLDVQALGPPAALASLQRDVLAWYLQPLPGDHGDEQWDYLVADLVRYANAYRNWQVARTGDTTDDSHALRRAKLASTRYVTWLGLWLLVLRASGGAGAGWLREQLGLSPIERVVTVLGEFDAQRAREALDCYERIVEIFGHADTRASLLDETLLLPGDEPAAGTCEAVRAAGAELRASVTAGVLAGFKRGAPWRVRMALPF